MKRLLALVLLAIVAAIYWTVGQYWFGYIGHDFGQWYIKLAVTLAVWASIVVVTFSMASSCPELNDVDVMFTLPFLAPMTILCYLLIEGVCLGRLSFEWPEGYGATWFALLGNLLEPYEGLINRIVTFTIGIFVFGIYGSIVAWAIGLIPLLGLAWGWRLLICPTILWSIAAFIEGLTYERHIYPDSWMGTSLVLAGPYGTFVLFRNKLISGRPLNRE